VFAVVPGRVDVISKKWTGVSFVIASIQLILEEVACVLELFRSSCRTLEDFIVLLMRKRGRGVIYQQWCGESPRCPR
jgi:hypothetical protein